MKTIICLAVCVGLLTSTALGQGSLTPPGSPSPTMKTLEQVEPRTPISSLPYSVRDPGSYYVTADLTGVSARDGITIDSDDVTIDLNGFTLRGVTGSRNGIYVLGTQSHIIVRNGIIRDWGIDGIAGSTASHSQFSDLKLNNNNANGLIAATGCLVENCQSSLNNDVGISIGNEGQVRRCTADNNNDIGINVGSNCQVLDSICTGSSTGLVAAANSLVTQCRADNNLVHGFVLKGGAKAKNCSASLNTQVGIIALDNSSIVGCTTVSNSTDGILVSSSCTVKDNSCQGNGVAFFGAGIHVTGNDNRIESNHLTGADRGLWITGTDNYISDNTVLNNAENYTIANRNQLNLMLSEIPQTISWPAKVELAGTLTGIASEHGINIDASQVTIDMNGHSLIGASGSLNGINIVNTVPDHYNITIRNGILRDWGGDGIDGVFSSNSIVHNVKISNNGTHGIEVDDNWIIHNCQAAGNGSIGILASDNCNIYDCTSIFNASNGIRAASVTIIRNCVVQKNGASGIRVGNDNLILHNTADDNDRDGIRLTSGDSRVDSNHVTDNEWRGIAATSAGALIIRNTAAGNDTNYFFAANNRHGPIVDVDSINGDISVNTNSVHPWANFEF